RRRARELAGRSRTMLKLATKFEPRKEAFEQAHQAGFRAAELWLDAGVLARWGEAAELAAVFPLEYALHFPNRLEQSAQTPEAAVQLYRAVGAHALVIHQPHFDRYGAALRELAPELRLAVENHLLDRAGFWRWAEDSPGLALDVEHLWMRPLTGEP